MHTIKSKVFGVISNANGDFKEELEFLVTPKITDLTPHSVLDISNIEFPNCVELADPEFFKPNKVHILLGAETFFKILKYNSIKISDSVLLQNSVFGYIVSGRLPCIQPLRCLLSREQDNLEQTIAKFWELESIEESVNRKGDEEQFCENHFQVTHTRDQTGKYVVQMPLKNDPETLGKSKEMAWRRLTSLWNRLAKNPELCVMYQNFMREYEELGHMREVEEEEEPNVTYYIPHHSVYRPDKSTTKLRVVFNASAPSSNGTSLNSLQANGGVIQDDLFSIMTRFRKYRIALTADVQKMYRMIMIDPSQRDLQRILWKGSPHEPVKEYRLCTVTYGTTSAPYLATRTLKQLAIDEGNKFPVAAAVLQRDFYMDDLVSGSQDVASAVELQEQLILLLQSGGMKLHKWSSNDRQLLQSVPYEEQEYHFDKDKESIKTLGLKWNPNSDTFEFSVTSTSDMLVCTKRSVLSEIARLFDPLGLLGPVIVKAKILMQKLWMLKIDWEDQLPEPISQEWMKFVSSLNSLLNIKIDRYVLNDDCQKTVLHCFADASEAAFGAVVYLQCIASDGTASAKLVSSKSRVAPLKTISIPRLELCACLLVSQLMRKVQKSLTLVLDDIILYSDSTISLAWIRTPPHRLKTFVANRVAKIQQLSEDCAWRHVPSTLNPADIISRGAYPQELASLNLWWNGPQFLKEPTTDVSGDADVEASSDLQYRSELKPTVNLNLVAVQNDFIDNLLNITNNYTKIINIFSFVFRFINGCRKKNRDKGPLTVEEVRRNELKLISIVQKASLSEDFSNLSNGNEVTKNSDLKCLCPFIDECQVIRVGGRLRKANLSYGTKHPIVLPKGHRLTYLVMLDHHIRHCHVGPQSLLHCVRQRFWPIGGRNFARKITHECVICVKNKPLMLEQTMGDLPEHRINPSFPFIHTGVDFCGPFLIKYKNQRKGQLHKIYVAIFVCFATRAVHLEIVTDLSSESFIATLKRFMSRRGKCATLYTDNARNFVGANNELKRLHNMVKYPDDSLARYLVAERINWKFIPPRAPHFGGLWEAGVKSFKFHLKRAVGNLKFTYEEFLTITDQIEGILNSRPITPLSNDANEPEALTPAHFLIGRPVTAIVEPDLTDLSDNSLKRWQRTTKVTQYLWKRWQRDYLSHLQQRTKWYFSKNNIEKDAMVIVREDNMPPSSWLLGKIEKLIYGKDNKVRVCMIKTKQGIIKRPITKLAILPVNIS